MKKGYLSSYDEVSLRVLSQTLIFMAEIEEQRAINSDAIFLTAAFQAGIDEFLVSNSFGDPLTTSSTFIASRTTPFSNNPSFMNYKKVIEAFSAYLPSDWHIKLDEFNPVIHTAMFIATLMDAMSAGASLLSTFKFPDPVEIKELIPDELFYPVSHLFSTFTAVQILSPIPQCPNLNRIGCSPGKKVS